jgi:hypothetical protein
MSLDLRERWQLACIGEGSNNVKFTPLIYYPPIPPEIMISDFQMPFPE